MLEKQKRVRPWLNQSGFSILEMVVVAALGIIVIMGLSKSMSMMTKSGAKTRLNMQLIDLETELRNKLTDPAYCLANFSGTLPKRLNMSSVTTSALKTDLLKSYNEIKVSADPAATNMFQVGSPIGSLPNVQVTGIGFYNTLRVAPETYRSDLIVNVTHLGTELNPIKVLGVNIETNPAHGIANKGVVWCSTGATDLEMIDPPPTTPPPTYDDNLQNYCLGFGGNFDTASNRCDITELICQTTGQAYDAVAKTCIGAPPPPPPPGDTVYPNPTHTGLPVATFGGNGWSTWNRWCREQGHSQAKDPVMGPTARPCCGNSNRAGSFTSWRCNYFCNYATLASITCF